MAWFVYLLECQDGSIYTGIALDVEKRFIEHVSGKGARYTRANPPKKILARKRYSNRSLASKAEYRIKQLTAQEKRAFCAEVSSVKKNRRK